MNDELESPRWSLTETAIVVAILLLLAAIAVPAFMKDHERARKETIARAELEQCRLASQDATQYPLAMKVKARDGTNYIGVYLGMIAEFDGAGGKTNWSNGKIMQDGVMMFSATSGGLLKWIPFQDFKEIFVYKTRPEYPSK